MNNVEYWPMLAANAPAGGPLDAVSLTGLMRRSAGSPEIIVGLIDGSVAARHRDLATESIRILPQATDRTPAHASAPALTHGTFVAGIRWNLKTSEASALAARAANRRASVAPHHETL